MSFQRTYENFDHKGVPELQTSVTFAYDLGTPRNIIGKFIRHNSPLIHVVGLGWGSAPVRGARDLSMLPLWIFRKI